MGCSKSREDTPAPIQKLVTKGIDKKRDTEANEDYASAVKFLQHVPLFKRLPLDHHPLLAAACEAAVFKPHDVIIQQGDVGNEFFVIRAGEASVHVSKKSGESIQVAILKAGDYFGEVALLRDDPRNATITAQTELETLKITRERFQELRLPEKLRFATRKAVGAGGRRNVATKPPSKKTMAEHDEIASALLRCEHLKAMVVFNQARVEQLVYASWKEHVAADDEIIKEGDLHADYFYIVSDGLFEVLVLEKDTTATSAERCVKRGESKVVTTIGKGGCFGELALLYFVPRAATVVAELDSVVWVIDRNSFKDILMNVSNERLAEFEGYLAKVEVLSALIVAERRELAQAMVDMHFTKGEVILQQGEPGSTFYVLYDGTVDVIRDGKKEAQLYASSGRQQTQFFGERALISSEDLAETVQVVSDTAKALALDRESFNILLGPLEQLITMEGAERAAHLGKGKSKYNAAGRTHAKISREDLVKLSLLGTGAFGAVYLFEHRSTSQAFAMKSLSKGYVMKLGMQDNVMNEKNIMLMTNSDFIIRLYECYNGSQMLYFLMEVAMGGELYAIYNRTGLYGSEPHARFYLACVVLAFEHLHERRILYRDLKPENLLLNDEGYLKVTDMGLAKFIIGKTYTTCGTPDYFAPEVIASTGHSFPVDWWTLGIFAFEMLAGHPPFESNFPVQVYSKVMKGIGKVAFPPKAQGASELIKQLLKAEPSERLPVRTDGIQKLKKHEWFETSGLDWDGILQLTASAPYKPVVKDKTDASNFSANTEEMPPHLEYKDDGSGWDNDFAT
eukprot:NODE_905_length_2705_cov_16.142746.p1 GENE.NODE_905_length_2705_cov_16.142746~~NODE_905_length_2705_cov_16.142746.p1  ORF type:complete len:794 (-),score=177.35 NODE_905_length_2705_cov_16.142746:238-2619(-)